VRQGPATGSRMLGPMSRPLRVRVAGSKGERSVVFAGGEGVEG
jgi:hypothetical protein